MSDAARPGRPGAGALLRAARRRLRPRAACRAPTHVGALARLRPGRPRPSRCSRPRSLGLARAVADHYGGTLADVLRLAVPPRHAAAEAKPSRGARCRPPAVHREPGPWSGLPGRAGVPPGRRLTAARPARRVDVRCPDRRGRVAVGHRRRGAAAGRRAAERSSWSPTPATSRGSRPRSTEVCGPGHHVELTADLGPAERYRRFLRRAPGLGPRCVVGTRAAMFAPVHDLGLAVVWDDGDDLHAEPHAPYPHVREVLAHAGRARPARRSCSAGTP